jgi:hypothetical protein
MRIRIRIGAELTGDELEAVRAQAVWPEQMPVRPTHNRDYSGYTQRAVCATATAEGNSIGRAWLATNASTEFGHLDMDPLDELRVLKIAGELAGTNTTDNIAFTSISVIGNLFGSG